MPRPPAASDISTVRFKSKFRTIFFIVVAATNGEGRSSINVSRQSVSVELEWRGVKNFRHFLKRLWGHLAKVSSSLLHVLDVPWTRDCNFVQICVTVQVHECGYICMYQTPGFWLGLDDWDYHRAKLMCTTVKYTQCIPFPFVIVMCVWCTLHVNSCMYVWPHVYLYYDSTSTFTFTYFLHLVFYFHM